MPQDRDALPAPTPRKLRPLPTLIFGFALAAAAARIWG